MLELDEKTLYTRSKLILSAYLGYLLVNGRTG